MSEISHVAVCSRVCICPLNSRTWCASITPHVSGSLVSSAQVTPSPIPCRQLFTEHLHTCPVLNPWVSIRGHTVAGDTHSLFPQERPGCSLAHALPRVQEGLAFIPIGSSPLAVILLPNLCHVDEVGIRVYSLIFSLAEHPFMPLPAPDTLVQTSLSMSGSFRDEVGRRAHEVVRGKSWS